jgi:hypothetical protein
MPNDCWNYITITCEDCEELNNLYINELIREEGRDYESEFYYYKNITIEKKCFKGIKFQQLTAWKPDYEWLESLLTKYPNCWIKNEWNEEGGIAGVWVGSVNNGIQTICWEDLCIEKNNDIFTVNNKTQKK